MRVLPKGAALGSDADDAIFLAASYGLTPDDWQEDAIDDWLLRGRKGIWLASTCGLAVPRQNGKNAIIEVRELYGLVILGEKFLHTAHEVKTARKAFKRLKHFFGEQANDPNAKFPELNALVREIRSTNGQEAVVLHATDCRTRDPEQDGGCNCSDGPSVEFVARSKGSGRGFTVDVLVLDEAQDLTDEELEALLPTISSAPLRNPQIIMTGTPPNPEKNQTGEVFTRVREDAKTGADPRLAFTDYGVADGPLAEIDLDDLDQLRACNPALSSGRLQLEVCRTERRRMSSAGYARERLGWWGEAAAGATSTFGPGRWEACGSLEIEFPEKPDCIGVAVSVDRLTASIAAASVRESDEADDSDDEMPAPDLIFVAAVDRRDDLGWLVDEVARIQAAYDCSVVIDEKGPAADLLDDFDTADVAVETVDLGEYAEACSRFFDKVRANRVQHPSSRELNEAVAGADWRWVTDRRVWGRKSSETDVSMLEAATLAAYGAEEFGTGIW